MNPTQIPDTAAYLLLGLVVFFGFLAVFAASMWARYRNLQKDLLLIETLSKENKR